ncbi:6629_t:CDS:2 [Funneliformis caledonium]|uniref:6629_t:CDS:1 n=1 Tax=Funneliformis caledonium TaxID=1117310 RepID=A0A9N8ZAW1_9GLOM|nr:6629_t:CDS:2 [Funneliformis caledonium]
MTGIVASLSSVAIGSVVTALGFGKAGICAGSIAAWMMSLQGGAVAAGSLVAILQSVGAAGFSIGTAIATSSGGGVLGGYIAKAMLNTLESNREELKELEKFGFEVARESAKDRAKKFEFLVIRDFKGSNYLYRYFDDKHGIDHVTSEKRSISEFK